MDDDADRNIIDDANSQQVASILLEKKYPVGYLEEWTELIKQSRDEGSDEKLHSVIIFRTEDEWLAMSVKVVKEIMPVKVVHTIPHKMNSILKGTVNVNGQLKLYISLSNLLEIGSIANKQDKFIRSGHMCLIGLGSDDWLIKVDEIYGIRRISLSSLENVPVTITKSTANFLKGIFRFDGKDVGYIEEELVFHCLKRRACG